MQRRWFVGLAVVVLVLTTGATFPVSGASDIDSGVALNQQPPQLNTPEGFNNTAFTVTVSADGTARWTIAHYRFLGDNQSTVDQYQSFASRFNSTETETYRDFKSRTRALTAFGSDATNRQMNATAFSKVAYVEQQFRGRVGVLQMSFNWTNFARTTADGVVVDDVFEGGMYVGQNQRLVFENGSNLVFNSATPTPDELATRANLTASHSVEYHGEQEFDDEEPTVVLVHPDALGATRTSTPTPDRTLTATPTDAMSSEVGPVPIVVAVVLLLVVGGGLAWYSGTLGDVVSGRGGADAGATTESVSTASTAEAESAEPAVPEEELLSDEDRVLKLLEDNGGRMKQVNIVENTEWSKSKVSMLLSDMEEEGLISKLRVGRENIISKAGEEPDAVGSPFDDE